MRRVVRTSFFGYSARFESVCPWMYLDVKRLMTTGVGNRVETLGAALLLPWMRADGSRATSSDVQDEWNRISARVDLAPWGGGAFRSVAKLHLTQEAIAELVDKKLDANEVWLSGRFSQYAVWPADAQLGVHSIAWAAGASFRFPLFEAAIRRQDFVLAADECHLDEHGNPGVHPRNIADRALFLNAAAVLRLGLDPDVLYWPGDATQTQETEPGDDDPGGEAA